MNVTIYHSGNVVINANHKEYDILLQAILLLSWSAISVDTNTDKLKLIESIENDMKNIKLEK